MESMSASGPGAWPRSFGFARGMNYNIHANQESMHGLRDE